MVAEGLLLVVDITRVQYGRMQKLGKFWEQTSPARGVGTGSKRWWYGDSLELLGCAEEGVMNFVKVLLLSLILRVWMTNNPGQHMHCPT